jgi:hypothetical protein
MSLRERAVAAALGLAVALIPVGAQSLAPPTPRSAATPVKPPAFTGAASGSLHYALDIRLLPADHRLSVDATVTLPPAAAGKAVDFQLADSLAISAATPAVTQVAAAAAPRGFVGIDAATSAPARRYRLTVPADGVIHLHYDGIIDAPVHSAAEEYARGFQETTGIIEPRGVYLAGSTLWYPNFGDELFTFELSARAPAGWQLIGVGEGTASDAAGVAHWRSEEVVDELQLVGGPLERYVRQTGAVEAEVYLHAPDEALADRYLEATGRYLALYRDLVGPYPYGKFALVENFWETGYGMPSFTLLGHDIIRFPFIITSSYPHEILHNWWGNSVFVDYATGNWCEGLTAYLADHLFQELAGRGAEFRRDTLRRYRDFARAGRDFPLAQFRSRHSAATEAVGYGKTLMGFHALRLRLGDERFREALREFYRENRGRRASFADLRRVFEAVSGEDLGGFFSEWTGRPGAPELALEGVRVDRRGSAWVVSGTLRQLNPGPPFSLDVPLLVSTTAGTVSRPLRLEHSVQPFEILTAAEPELLEVDPEFDAFRVLDARETAPSVGQLFGDPQVLAVLPAAAEPGRLAAYRTMLAAWAPPATPIEAVLDRDVAQLPADRSVWIFGRDNRFAPLVLTAASRLGAQWTVDGAVLDGQSLAFAGHSLVLVARHPANVEKALGWIHVDPLQGAGSVAEKLPHYGKYSYLGFAGPEARNVAKGEWPNLDSPLRVDLRPAGARAGAPAPIRLVPRRALAELPPRAILLELARAYAARGAR